MSRPEKGNKVFLPADASKPDAQAEQPVSMDTLCMELAECVMKFYPALDTSERRNQHKAGIQVALIRAITEEQAHLSEEWHWDDVRKFWWRPEQPAPEPPTITLKFYVASQAQELAALRERYKTDSVTAIASENINVADYCQHWERRAEKAEAALAAARRDVLLRLLTKFQSPGTINTIYEAIDTIYEAILEESAAQPTPPKGETDAKF